MVMRFLKFLFFVKKCVLLRFLSLFVSLSVPQFHRETTLRTPRELPDTANLQKVRFVKIAPLHLFSAREFPRE